MPPFRVEAHWGGQVMKGVMADVWLPVDPVGPQTHPGQLLVPDCVIGTGILGSWENPTLVPCPVTVRKVK